MHAPYISPADDSGDFLWSFIGKSNILEAEDLLGARYRKAMSPKKLWTLLFPHQLRFRSLGLDRFIRRQNPGAGWGREKLIDLLMGLFRGAVFRHGGGARKQPIEQRTGMPTSTMALMGRFLSLMGRFPTLMGRFADFVLRGRFTS